MGGLSVTILPVSINGASFMWEEIFKFFPEKFLSRKNIGHYIFKKLISALNHQKRHWLIQTIKAGISFNDNYINLYQ